MFLWICGHNEVQRDVGLRFGKENLEKFLLQLSYWHAIILELQQDKIFFEILKNFW